MGRGTAYKTGCRVGGRGDPGAPGLRCAQQLSGAKSVRAGPGRHRTLQDGRFSVKKVAREWKSKYVVTN